MDTNKTSQSNQRKDPFFRADHIQKKYISYNSSNMIDKFVALIGQFLVDPYARRLATERDHRESMLAVLVHICCNSWDFKKLVFYTKRS